MTQILLLVLAAVLEVGGDALIRHGLAQKSTGVILMIAGVVVLGIYGFMVNLTKLDFGKLMGIYIVIFFVVSQLMSALVFKETLRTPVLIGGSLIVIGGIVMMLLK